MCLPGYAYCELHRNWGCSSCGRIDALVQHITASCHKWKRYVLPFKMHASVQCATDMLQEACAYSGSAFSMRSWLMYTAAAAAAAVSSAACDVC